MSNPETVSVSIMGRNYILRSEQDPSYVEGLAEMVHERMQAIERNTNTVDTVRVAVLASLNLADEYATMKARYEARIAELEAEQERLDGLISDALERPTSTEAKRS